MAISVYMSGEKIKIAVGSGGAASLNVSALYDLPLDEASPVGGVLTPESGITDKLSEIWKSYSFPRSGVKLTVDSAQFYLKPLRLPKLSDKKLLAMISHEFTENNSFELPIIDYKVLRRNLKNIDIVAAAVEKSFIESYISAFSAAGIKLSSVDCAVCSALDFFMGIKSIAKKTYIAELTEGDTLQSVLVCDGIYRYSRRARLFSEPGSPDYAAEIGRTVSAILQFHASEKIESRVENIYFCGLASEYADAVIDGVKNTYGIAASLPPPDSNYRIASVVTTENGVSEAKAGDYVAICGNLMSGRTLK
ncbi:MAG: hypothetical protein WCQ72_04180 [Eubacteriales bacterium]